MFLSNRGSLQKDPFFCIFIIKLSCMDNFDYKGYLKSGKLFEDKEEGNRGIVSDYLKDPDNFQMISKFVSNPYTFLDTAMQSLNGGEDPEYREMARKALDSYEIDENVQNLYSALGKLIDKHRSTVLSQVKKDLILRVIGLIQDDLGIDAYDYESDIDNFVDSNFDNLVKPILDVVDY